MYNGTSQTWTPLDTVLKSNGNLGINIKYMKVIEDKIILSGGFNIVDDFEFPSLSGGICSYDGTNWDHFNDGLETGLAYSIEKYNDKLVFGGSFWATDHVLKTKYLAQWDGSNWESFHHWQLSSNPNALAVYDNKLFVAGGFGKVGPEFVWCLTAFDGSNWEAFGDGLGNPIHALAVYKDELYLGGWFSGVDGVPASYIAKYDGTNFYEVGGGLNGFVNDFYVDTVKDELYIGGAFTMAGDSVARGIVKWDGEYWHPLGTGVNYSVFTDAITLYHDDLYVGGDFNEAGGDSISFIARWNGVKWDSLDLGVNDFVHALIVYEDTLWIGGAFTEAGGQLSYGLAKWHTPKPPLPEFPNQMLGDGINGVNSEEILIYPNPSSGIFTINAPFLKGNNVHIAVHNIEGKLILEQKLKFNKDAATIETSLPKGVYQLSITSNEYNGSTKVIIE